MSLGSGVCGPTGRFKTSLVKKIASQGGAWDDRDISPVVRQTRECLISRRLWNLRFITVSVQHWAYRLTERDYNSYIP